MVVATDKPKRYVHRHLNYKGDLREVIPIGKIMGPNAMNELFVVLKTEYDPETDMTRVGFDWARQTDFEPDALEGVEIIDAD